MYKKYIKRVIDIAIALLAFLLLFPVFFIVMLILIISFSGNPFFIQERPGLGEKRFKLIKFKSMNNNQDNEGNLLPDKERLTGPGKFIRKYSLDEIPQLLNVIKGDMSLVGPRPLLIRYLPFYTEREKLRHSVKPGITGLAQVSGRNNISWEKRLELDVRYIENVSFKVDIKILLTTILHVLRKEGVIPDKKENYFDIERRYNKIK